MMFDIKSTYLNSAYLGPMPVQAKNRIEKLMTRMLDPAFYPHSEWRGIPDDLRKRIAALLEGDPERVSINSSVSEVLGFVADGLDLKPSDEVVLMEGDYPSMVLPWMVRAERTGFKLKFVPQKTFWDPDRLMSELGPNTRVVSNTHVMFNTGIRLPSEEIAPLCKARGVFYVSDISQSFGGMTIPKALVENADVVTGVGYKWLLGPYGTAFGYFSERCLQNTKRTHASWLQNPRSQSSENLLDYSTESMPGARKFDRGQTANFLTSEGFKASLDLLLTVGLKKVEEQNATLVQKFIDNLPKKFEVLAHDKSRRSNIVCINQKGLDSGAMKEKLAKANIDVSVREGSLRISMHLFNTEKDIERLLAQF